MKVVTIITIAVCAIYVLVPNSQAQRPGAPAGFGAGAPRPTLSPYLNLANSGDPAVNYYGLVRPQIAYNRAIQNINADLNYLESSSTNDSPSQTGQRSSFMTQGKYFMNNGVALGASANSQQAFRQGSMQGGNVMPKRR